MQKIKTIQNELDGTSALLVTSSANRFYLTGFNSSAGSVLITKNNAYFLIDFRYFEKAKKVAENFQVLLSVKPYEEINGILKQESISKLFIECSSTSLEKYNTLKTKLENIHISTDVKFDKLLIELRAIKSEEEINLINEAQKLTDKTFSYILNNIKEGRTEREIMLDMEFFMRSQGAESAAFDFVVVSGENSSLPHGVPTDKKIEIGDYVTMDFGAVVGGYRSDMTRTVAVGGLSNEQIHVYDTVLKAQLVSLAEIRAGAVCSSIDKTARDIISSSGYEGKFGHGLGHSVGVEIHETPSFSPSCDTILKSGMIMTVEPGIYLEGQFGVRIEDMVLIKDDGIINLTKSPKELIIL